MIYTVHGYYGKWHSQKAHKKIEACVFARNAELAEKLVRKLFDGYPADIEYLTVAGGQIKDEAVLYDQRPELLGINPDTGYIYNEFSHKNAIYRYFK